MEQPISAGMPGLIKHVSAYSSSMRYTDVTVTRVTKARVFARSMPDGREVEFRLDNLREYGEKSWRADELIVDPDAIARTRAALAAEKARKALEGRAITAASDLQRLFEGHAVRARSEAEILSLEAFRDSLSHLLPKRGG